LQDFNRGGKILLADNAAGVRWCSLQPDRPQIVDLGAFARGLSEFKKQTAFEITGFQHYRLKLTDAPPFFQRQKAVSHAIA
jgi:hypothetical protein